MIHNRAFRRRCAVESKREAYCLAGLRSLLPDPPEPKTSIMTLIRQREEALENEAIIGARMAGRLLP